MLVWRLRNGPPANLSQAVTGSSRRVRRPSLRMGEGGPTGPRSHGAIRRCQPEGARDWSAVAQNPPRFGVFERF
jgi:hypothetical protein